MNDDILLRLRSKVAGARALELRIEELEEMLEHARSQYNLVLSRDIPDLMAEAGVTKVAIEADGNMPAVEAEVRPIYAASIPASWDDERRSRAMRALDEHGAGDLIKTTVEFDFPRGRREAALDLARSHDDLEPRLGERVHSATLRKWLQTAIENGDPTPPLEVIGAYVSQKAVLKRRRD